MVGLVGCCDKYLNMVKLSLQNSHESCPCPQASKYAVCHMCGNKIRMSECALPMLTKISKYDAIISASSKFHIVFLLFFLLLFKMAI